MPDWFRYVSEVAVTILAPMSIWAVKMLVEIRDSQRKMAQTVYGVNGDNGMRSEVTALQQTMNEHETRLQLLGSHK